MTDEMVILVATNRTNPYRTLSEARGRWIDNVIEMRRWNFKYVVRAGGLLSKCRNLGGLLGRDIERTNTLITLTFSTKLRATYSWKAIYPRLKYIYRKTCGKYMSRNRLSVSDIFTISDRNFRDFIGLQQLHGLITMLIGASHVLLGMSLMSSSSPIHNFLADIRSWWRWLATHRNRCESISGANGL